MLLKVLGGQGGKWVRPSDVLTHGEMSKSSHVEVLHPRWPAGRIVDQNGFRQAFWVAQGQCDVSMLRQLRSGFAQAVTDQRCERKLAGRLHRYASHWTHVAQLLKYEDCTCIYISR